MNLASYDVQRELLMKNKEEISEVRGHALRKILKVSLKSVQFEAFWRQISVT